MLGSELHSKRVVVAGQQVSNMICILEMRRMIRMYRVYQLTDEEKDKIVRCRWDGDTHYYDVFESQEECDEEQKRLDKIEAEYRKMQADYLKNCKGE